MSDNISLKQIERKAYRSTHQDGLWDICWGLLLLGFGFAPVFETLGLPRPLNIIPAVVIPLVLVRFGKRLITIPRMGIVRFGSQRKTNKRRLRIVAIVLFIVTVIQVILTLTGAFPPNWMIGMGRYAVPIIIALFAVLIFSIFAYFKDVPRLFLIGVLYGISIMLSEYFHYHLESPYDGLIGCGVPAIIIMIIGLRLLVRFMKKYPKPNEAEVIDGC